MFKFNFFKKKEINNGIKVLLVIEFYHHGNTVTGQQMLLSHKQIPLETIAFKDDYVFNTAISFLWTGTKEELQKFLSDFSKLGNLKRLVVN